jgi:hypothetical protein
MRSHPLLEWLSREERLHRILVSLPGTFVGCLTSSFLYKYKTTTVPVLFRWRAHSLADTVPRLPAATPVPGPAVERRYDQAKIWFTLFRTCCLRDGFKYPAGQVSRLTFLVTSVRWQLPVPDRRFWALVAIVIAHAAPQLTDRKKMRVVHARRARRSTVASAAPLDQLDVDHL